MENRKFFKKLSVLVMMLVLCVSVLTACGGPANLEEAFQDDDVKAALEKVEKNGVKITAEDNEMIYTYTFDDTYDFSDSTLRDATVAQLKAGDATLKSGLKEPLKEIEEDTGLEGLSVRVVYLDSNGDTLYETNFDY